MVHKLPRFMTYKPKFYKRTRNANGFQLAPQGLTPLQISINS